MPTKEPMFWVAPVVSAMIFGGGSGVGMNYLWPVELEVDLVMEYRVTQSETRGMALTRRIAELEARYAELPPPDWRNRIFNIERDVRKISDAMIRLEQHGHPELHFEEKE